MKQAQYTKFSPITVATKANMKRIRLAEGDNMNEAAAKLGVSRKVLEDIETDRNYGCHLDLELLAKYQVVYGHRLDSLVPVIAKEVKDPYYERPRARIGSKRIKSK